MEMSIVTVFQDPVENGDRLLMADCRLMGKDVIIHSMSNQLPKISPIDHPP